MNVRKLASRLLVAALGVVGSASALQAAPPGYNSIFTPPQATAPVAPPTVELPPVPDNGAAPSTPMMPPTVPLPPGAEGSTPPPAVPQPPDPVPAIPAIPSPAEVLATPAAASPVVDKRRVYNFGVEKFGAMPLGWRVVDVESVTGDVANVTAHFGQISQTYTISATTLKARSENRSRVIPADFRGVRMTGDLRHAIVAGKPLGFVGVTLLDKKSGPEGDEYLVSNPDLSAYVYWVRADMLHSYMNPDRLSSDAAKADGEYGFADLAAYDAQSKRIKVKLVDRNAPADGCILVSLGGTETYAAPIESWEPAEAPLKVATAPAAAAPVASASTGFAAGQQLVWRQRVVTVTAVLNGKLKIHDFSGPGGTRADYVEAFDVSEFSPANGVATTQPQATQGGSCYPQQGGMVCNSPTGSCYRGAAQAYAPQGQGQSGVICNGGNCYKVNGQTVGCNTGTCGTSTGYGQSGGCGQVSGCSQPSSGGFHPLQNMQQGKGFFGLRGR